MTEQDITGSGDQEITVALLGDTDQEPFGLSAVERLRRALQRQGVHRFIGPHAPPPQTGSVLLMRGDCVYDESLSAGLVRRRDFILLDTKGRAVAAHVVAARIGAVQPLIAAQSGDAQALAASGLTAVTAADLANAARKKLRTREPPYILSLPELGRAPVERRMYRAAYKGVTDFVTKFIWPLPALWATRFCARRRISPNMVTLISLACVIAATWLFSIGWFGVGLVFAWAMAFLDTVDGKLARVTLMSSRWGEFFDHGIDHIHPPFWWWAWWLGLNRIGIDPSVEGIFYASLWIIIGGYVAGRLQEGVFLWRFKMEMHVWRRVDSLFRLVTARRNPNLAILTVFTIAGQPATGFVAVALWTVISLGFHFVRISQAFRIKKRDGALRSWLDG